MSDDSRNFTVAIKFYGLPSLSRSRNNTFHNFLNANEFDFQEATVQSLKIPFPSSSPSLLFTLQYPYTRFQLQPLFFNTAVQFLTVPCAIVQFLRSLHCNGFPYTNSLLFTYKFKSMFCECTSSSSNLKDQADPEPVPGPVSYTHL